MVTTKGMLTAKKTDMDVENMFGIMELGMMVIGAMAICAVMEQKNMTTACIQASGIMMNGMDKEHLEIGRASCRERVSTTV